MSKKRSIYLVMLSTLLIMLGTVNSYGQFRDSIVINESGDGDPVYFSARDSIRMDLKSKKVHLYGDAKVTSSGVDMNSGYILIDLDKNEVLSTYAYDNDSNKVEFPVFTDGGDEVRAHTIRYNIQTKKGYIEELAVQQDENYLYMGIAKRHANEELHFKKGRFTHCDLEEPHYHFQLSKAVLVPNKRIVSGPMNLWIGGVPTPLGLPFSIIPQSEDRAKGLIFPEIIPSSQYGFGLQDLGFYWPINDHLQTTFYGSLYSRGSWGLRNRTDYAKRYGYRGLVDVGFQQFKTGFPTYRNANKFSLNWTHNKDPKSNPYWGFTSRVNFISDNNTQNNLDPLNQNYFNNTLSSDVNLTRAFPGKPITSGMKLSLRQNSLSKNVSLTAPVINVNVTRVFPFKKLVQGNKPWKQAISRFGITYGFEGQNRALFEDTLIRDNNYSAIGSKFLNGISQNLTAQTTIGLFKNTWKLTPSVTYGNRINFQQTQKTHVDTVGATFNSITIDTNQRAGMAHTLSLNAQLTTVLYTYYRFVGKKQPKLRHILTPSFTFRYIPALNPNVSYVTPDTVIEYSRFERSLYSIGQTNNQALLNFGFNNTFELKRMSDKDTVTGFKKTRLIDAFSITGSYDFLKEEKNLSNLSMNLRVSPVTWLNFVGSATFSPYNWNDTTGAELSDYAVEHGRLGRIVRSTFSTTLTFTTKESREKIESNVGDIAKNWNADFNYFLLHPEAAINFDIPWKVSLSHVFTLDANTNITEFNPDRWRQLQTLMINGDVSFTKRWKLVATVNMDLKEWDVTNTRLTLTRDMHCWALAFNWIPIGGNQSFLFSVRSTSSLFKDAPINIRRPPAFL